MTKDQIKALQQQLNAKGANLAVDGVLGPKTVAAMNQFQSTAATTASTGGSMNTEQVKQLQQQLNAQGAGLTVDGVMGPKTQQAMNAAVAKSVASNPVTAPLVAQNGGDPNAIIQAYQTGDWSNVRSTTGQPFTNEQQAAAVAQAQAALAPQFKEQQSNDTAAAESALGGIQDDFSNYENTQAKQFQSDKNAQDQTAANNGILFAGSRVQKLNDLKGSYETAQDQKARATGRQIASVAQPYQYKYGNDAAGKLSNYYSLGGLAFDPNKTAGAATPTNKLSSYYSPSAYNYQGTAVNANNANAQVRAAALLANKANKILPSGYNTQL